MNFNKFAIVSHSSNNDFITFVDDANILKMFYKN